MVDLAVGLEQRGGELGKGTAERWARMELMTVYRLRITDAAGSFNSQI